MMNYIQELDRINEYHEARQRMLDEPDDQPHVCTAFACGHHLTPQEQLYGSRCANHQETIKLTNIINQFL